MSMCFDSSRAGVQAHKVLSSGPEASTVSDSPLRAEHHSLLGVLLKIQRSWGFPGGAVVETLPANAGDTGSSPGLGRSHMPQSN